MKSYKLSKNEFDTPNFCDQIFNIRYKTIIIIITFFALRPQTIWIFVEIWNNSHRTLLYW